MAGVVNAQAMANKYIPLRLAVGAHQRENIVHYTIVHGVQIPHVEAVIRLADVRLKVAWKQRPPGGRRLGGQFSCRNF